MVDWSLYRAPDPFGSLANGVGYGAKLQEMLAQKRAGQAYASGDYAGAAKTLAASGDVRGAAALQRLGQEQTQTDQARKEAAYGAVSKAIPYFDHVMQDAQNDPDGGSARISEAFDHIAPWLQGQTGATPQDMAAIKSELTSNPKAALDFYHSQLPTQYKVVGRALVRQQGDNVMPVYEGQKDAPAGYQYGPDGKMTFVPGGPADPQTVKSLAQERRTVIVNNPIPTITDAPVPLGAPDATAPNITGQTGLSMDGFNYLIGNMSAMGRDKVTRARAAREAGEFAARSGTDVSTIKSRYTALNNVLQNNLQRANQMDILNQEVQGTVDNLAPVADKLSPSNIRWTREGVEFVGGLQNDPNVQQYATYLNQLRADLAGFNAVSGGKMTENGNARTDESDFRAAEKTIGSGLSSGGARGLAQAIQETGIKNRAIVDKAIEDTNRSVWQLFGVGKNWDATHPHTNNGNQKKSGRFTIEAVQ